jgi:uncharacterized RDD family membrane protein YckC
VKQIGIHGGEVASTATAPKLRSAGLEARLVAFIFDTIILLAFAAVFAVIALFQFLVQSNFGEHDPPDSSYYLALGIIAAVVPFWLTFNLWLQVWRGQTVGKYIVGIRVTRNDGRRLGLVSALWRMLMLNPLLFHPILMIPWALLAIFGTMLTENLVVLIVTVTLALLSLLAPLIALVAVSADKQRRALHDRIAGTLVVQMS